MAARNLFDNDGLKSTRTYFLYNFIADILAIVALILVVAGAAAGITGPGALLVIAAIIVLIPAIILGMLSILGLMFGLRDLRRGTLPSAKAIAKVSSWLKWLIVAIIVVTGIFYIAIIALTLTEFSDLYGLGSTSSASLVGTITTVTDIFTIVFLVLGVIAVLAIRRFYLALASDLQQPLLKTAALLLLAGIVLSVIATLISLFMGGANSLSASVSLTGGVANSISGPQLVAFLLDLVVVIVITVSYYLGYVALRQATK